MNLDFVIFASWAIRFLPLLEKACRKQQRPVGPRWRMDEMYILVKGVWKNLYRAVDKVDKTIDFLLPTTRLERRYAVL